MVRNCGIKNCKNNKQNCPDKKFFRIPRIRTNATYEIESLSLKRRLAWIAALGKPPNELTLKKLDNTDICQDHFVSGKPAEIREMTDVDWAPSVNLKIDAPEVKKDLKRKRLSLSSKQQPESVDNDNPMYLHGLDHDFQESCAAEIRRAQETLEIAEKIVTETASGENNENLLDGKRVAMIQRSPALKKKKALIPTETNKEKWDDYFSSNPLKLDMETTSNPE
ncbi:Hypothetical predicted protein [Cloeon dipterum]|uniref:THAP-type domain-containing protein n=1 Tax=Cloeon dipterum TaxID=197152 RepID=A0A8S1BNT2_9INSE|nr:Hypothetical predicted protein [Cloeon dipterum]